MAQRSNSFRTRLMWLVLAAVLIPTAALVGGSLYVGVSAREDMERRIDQTLNLAINLEKSLIDTSLERVREQAVVLALHPDLVAGSVVGTAPKDVLQDAQRAFPLADLITVVDADGVVLGRAHTDSLGDTLSYNGLIQQVIRSKQAASAIERILQPELSGDGLQVISQVRIHVVPTDLSSDPRVGTDLEDALAIVGIAPIIGPEGRVTGAVLVVDILNNDYRIVDSVLHQSPHGMPINATIALDGIRVTTNVPAHAGGRRAIGTQYSDPVMEKLRAGDEYRGRALVGGWQWQRTIYIPLRDHTGQVVAGGYVGISEEDFTRAARAADNTIWFGILIAVVSLGAALWVAYRLAQHSIIGPLRQITAMLRQGTLYTNVVHEGTVEVTELAQAINSMTGRIRKTVAETYRVSNGLKTAIATLSRHAESTAEGARSALGAVGGALSTSEQVGAGAKHASSRARELEVAITKVAAGADEHARAVHHVGWVTGEVTAAVRNSREMMSGVLSPAREAMVAAQHGRQSTLKALTALDSLRLSLDPEAEETKTVEGCQALTREIDDALRHIAKSTELALNRLWDLAAVLGENGARVAAISQQMEDVSQVVSDTTATTQTMGAASREIMQQVEAMEAFTAEAVDRVQSVQDHLRHIADSHQALLSLAENLEGLACELDAVTRQFSEG